MGQRERSAKRGSFWVAAATAAFFIAGCSVAITPTPGAGSAASPAASSTVAPAASAAATASPALASASPAVSEGPDLSPMPSGALPHVGRAPSSGWTGIKWIAVPDGHAPGDGGAKPGNWAIKGWSDGFIDFIWNPTTRTVVPWTSADGLTWTANKPLDTSVWAPGLATFDKNTPPEEHESCMLVIVEFEQAGKTMLLSAYVGCAGGCGSFAFTTATGYWTSPDGAAWTPVDASRAFGSVSPGRFSGGSAGFATLGRDNGKPALLISGDGSRWSRGALPAESTAAGTSFADPVSVTTGLVLPGSVLAHTGNDEPKVAEGGCAMMAEEWPNPPLYEPAVWTSSDGTSWSRNELPAAISAASVSLRIEKIDDHTMIATEYASDPADIDGTPSYESKTAYWVSHDGKTWAAIAGCPVGNGGHMPPEVLRGSSQGLLVCRGGEQLDQVTYWAVDASLRLTSVGESGEAPTGYRDNTAVGPTGLLMTQDGVHFWIGVPTAG